MKIIRSILTSLILKVSLHNCLRCTERALAYMQPWRYEPAIANWGYYRFDQNNPSGLHYHITYNMRMYWTNFWLPTVYVQQNIFEKALIDFYRPHFYVSFGTFCVQIGTVNHETFGSIPTPTTFSFDSSNLLIFKYIQRLTVPRIIDRFGRKRCQKKRKNVEYKLL